MSKDHSINRRILDRFLRQLEADPEIPRTVLEDIRALVEAGRLTDLENLVAVLGTESEKGA